MFINLKIYSLYVESIPLVIFTALTPLAVDVDIKFNAPPEIESGSAVIAERELFTANLRDIIYDTPYILIVPLSMLPLDILNLTLVKAVVVFTYPAAYPSSA